MCECDVNQNIKELKEEFGNLKNRLQSDFKFKKHVRIDASSIKTEVEMGQVHTLEFIKKHMRCRQCSSQIRFDICIASWEWPVSLGKLFFFYVAALISNRWSTQQQACILVFTNTYYVILCLFGATHGAREHGTCNHWYKKYNHRQNIFTWKHTTSQTDHSKLLSNWTWNLSAIFLNQAAHTIIYFQLCPSVLTKWVIHRVLVLPTQ